VNWGDQFTFASEQGGDQTQRFDFLPYPFEILLFLLQDLVDI